MSALGTVLLCGLCLCTHMPSQAAATCMLRCTCSLLGGMGRPDRSLSGPVQIGRTASDGAFACVRMGVVGCRAQRWAIWLPRLSCRAIYNKTWLPRLS
jgi:hypothetical protein